MFGQNGMQICGADGSVKTMDVPADLLAYLPQSQTPEPAETVQKDCGFCFASTHMPLLKSDKISLAKPAQSSFIKSGAGSYTPLGQAPKPYDSQGPPSFFV